MENVITVLVEEPDGNQTPIEVPTDMNLSLMEVLKGSGYPIEATCGGMALCATCHVEVLKDPGLDEAHDAELEMLDMVPNLTDNSRLACQIHPRNEFDGLTVRILGDH
ncbi:MAG: 2Fe-2S iron-sulfur cluster binding domain-containing protein [Bacteroidetes bacterium]|nr:MAG: 2Fe-2S iron-sulfur cluster binding domain-containing protein [Bacteroidota bacterium]